jgi:hypothetical protein
MRETDLVRRAEQAAEHVELVHEVVEQDPPKAPARRLVDVPKREIDFLLVGEAKFVEQRAGGRTPSEHRIVRDVRLEW